MDPISEKELAVRMRVTLDNCDSPPMSKDELQHFNNMYAISMMSGLKQCPHCSQLVTAMSKCKVKSGTYHVDLIY